MGENFDEFDEVLAIRQNFPCQSLRDWLIRILLVQDIHQYLRDRKFIKISPIKLLHYTVYLPEFQQNSYSWLDDM